MREDLENIQQLPQLKGVKLHIAAWITWDTKAEKLEYYNDEEEYTQRPRRTGKPRKSKYESMEEWKARVRE